MPRLLGQHGHDRLSVRLELAAEAAADLLRRELDLRQRHVEHLRRGVSDVEGPLRAVPDVDAPVVAPVDGAGVRLDVTLVYRRGVELALDDHVGFLEALGRVALLVLRVVGDVALAARVLAELGHLKVVVEDRSVVGHGRDHLGDGLQNIVVDLDRLCRFLRLVSRSCGDCRDRMASEDHLLPRHDSIAKVEKVGGELAERHLSGAVVTKRGLREVRRGHDRANGRVRFRLARVYRPYVSVGMWAAENVSVQHARRVNVRAVLGAAGYLVRAVVSDRARSDHIVLDL